MRKISILLFLAILAIQACAPAGEAAKAKRVNEIDKMGYFTPISYIGIIEKGNQARHSEPLSKESSELLGSLLETKRGNFNITDALTPADAAVNLKLTKEISRLAVQAAGTRRVNEIPLSPTIDSVMEASNERFALAFVATGFSRSKGNYGGQVAKGIGVGLLTLGMYAPVPVKANSTIHAVIFDSKDNIVTLYDGHQAVDKEPIDPKVVTKQVNTVLANLFKYQR